MIDLSVPDPGQIVQVRGRPFVVQGVLRSALPFDVLSGNPAQHLVTLS